MFYNIDHRCQYYKSFFIINDDETEKARAFLPGNHFQPGPIFVDEARSLPKSRTLEGHVPRWTLALLINTRLNCIDMIGTNALAYLAPLSVMMRNF
jgi:hypothetical protein